MKKSGTITGKAAILEPLNETNIWVATQPKNIDLPPGVYILDNSLEILPFKRN